MILVPLVILLTRQLLIQWQDPSQAIQKVKQRLGMLENSNAGDHFNAGTEVMIAAVACGRSQSRLQELSVMIKSAVMFSKTSLKFLIFTDFLSKEVESLLASLNAVHGNITWDIRPPLYPPLNDKQEPIKTAFAPCATQRLFFPQILPEYKAVLYVDTDIVFLQDPFQLWKQLDIMTNKSFALVTENDDYYYSTYKYSGMCLSLIYCPIFEFPT